MASVFQRDGSWVVKWRNAHGRWRQQRTRCHTKLEARRFADDLERRAERQAAGVEPLPEGRTRVTFGDLMDWWWRRHGSRLRSLTVKPFMEKHFREELGGLRLDEVTTELFDAFLAQKDAELAPKTLNHLRSLAYRMYRLASEPSVGKWHGPNPIAAVPRRKVPKRLPEFLRWDELPRVLLALEGQWRSVVATTVYTGMRKGEVFGLLKADLDFEGRTVRVCRSWDADTTKDGKPALIPMAEGLVPHLRAAVKSSGSQYVFPRADGGLHRQDVAADDVLRRALGRAGIVLGYEHRCRRHGCGFKELRPDATQARCPRCNFSLWPKAIPRHVRFHDLRHTTATLLLKEGAPLAVVQRILRHSDPAITTETYGHLELADMRAAIAKLKFEQVSSSDGAPVVRSSADSKIEAPAASEITEEQRGLRNVGETGFEPATPWSRTKCSTRLSHSPVRRAAT